ncbi:glycosyltransferase family 4 protein [Alteromonas mediterranea]|uniref:Glycosyl transferase family 1 n=1 Tax=Alteromonas mediterranea TaxID=314275 RepID=A0AAC8XMU5_9ALTE|nr:glycosyltransferase family 4 protein [Alteromonas mediterranea]RPH19066.1 MAG: glycosyltransferase [Alteromonadaceae bacterium TMED7]AFV87016.1 group 1 glycosyl transferase [Alteromonas mediterranea DE1]AGP99030.1 group 1 glycosyl transferase [Alteromonas mediterranea UM7]AGQ03209.1 group 1 glycosyl transferase [Alteromonas mediterranea UM4b]AMJ79936.1 glycosyl transferase family 1 [Alteromonas mediterranea]|tara:strand:+ start:9433 stop:10668 length:1236 start_codon:yes stop_codon:yes gene_type:complete
MDKKKILIIAHGHPDVHKGGAELAAYQLFNEYEKLGHTVTFLARSEEAPHGGAAFSVRNKENELLFHTRQDDDFLFSNIRTRYIWSELRDLLKRLQPEVVHFHHFFLMGIETLLEVRKTLPNVKIIFTLHEYLAICNANGLMLKPNTGKLCSKASPRDCHNCFPEKSPADFFMREMYIKRAFSVVDRFVSPSEFLKQRYVDWGIDSSLIEVIENGTPEIEHELSASATTSSSFSKVRLAYFGQINCFKGLDVLLDALQLMDKETRLQFVLNIHGANLEHQPLEFQEKVYSALKRLKGTVFLHGPYENHELPELLTEIDWMVVPSIWYENSPIVIQEAFRSGVPVIASNIGGMREKVVNEVNGLTFSVGKPLSLQSVLTRVSNNPDLLAKCKKGVQKPESITETALQNLALY